jgi:hypothetical protein
MFKNVKSFSFEFCVQRTSVQVLRIRQYLGKELFGMELPKILEYLAHLLIDLTWSKYEAVTTT